MAYSNDTLVNIKEEVESNLKSSINELKDVDEFKEVLNAIEEAMSVLNTESEPYEEAYRKECEAEEQEQNRQYCESCI